MDRSAFSRMSTGSSKSQFNGAHKKYNQKHCASDTFGTSSADFDSWHESNQREKQQRRSQPHQSSPQLPAFVVDKIFQDQELLGKGAFGEVFQAKWMVRKETIAIKKVRLKPRKRSFMNLFSTLRRTRQGLYDQKTLPKFGVKLKKFGSKKFKKLGDYHNESSQQSQNGSQFLPLAPGTEGEEQEFGVQKNTEQGSQTFGEVETPKEGKDVADIQSGGFIRAQKSYAEVEALEKMQVAKRSRVEMKKEVKMWSEMRGSSFLLQLYDTIWFRNQCWLVMELCSVGNLYFFVKNFQNDKMIPFTMDITKDMFGALFSGMRHMHRKGVIHRDIKPENILLNEHLQPKLADFGLAVEFDIEMGDRTVVPHSKAFDGTPSYAPPEAFFGYHYNSTWDTFSLMCSLYFMKFGKVCWEFGGKSWPDEKIAHLFSTKLKDQIENPSVEEQEERVEKAELEYLNEMHILPKNNFIKNKTNDDYEWTPERLEFGEFAQKCMSWNIEDRLTVAEVCESTMFKEIVEKWEAEPLKSAQHFKQRIQDWIEDDTYIEEKWLVF